VRGDDAVFGAVQRVVGGRGFDVEHVGAVASEFAGIEGGAPTL
jgi:hypothetical protein